MRIRLRLLLGAVVLFAFALVLSSVQTSANMGSCTAECAGKKVTCSCSGDGAHCDADDGLGCTATGPNCYDHKSC